MKFAPFCFCTVVAHKALQTLVEATAGGAYRDNHPWIIAAEMLAEAQERAETVMLMLATMAPAAAPAPDSVSRPAGGSDAGGSAGSAGGSGAAHLTALTPGVLEFAFWTTITSIEVNRFRQGSESRVQFGALTPVSELWAAPDSVQLLPSHERLRREALENLRASRQALDEYHLHPYAICVTPPFVLAQRKALSGNDTQA